MLSEALFKDCIYLISLFYDYMVRNIYCREEIQRFIMKYEMV